MGGRKAEKMGMGGGREGQGRATYQASVLVLPTYRYLLFLFLFERSDVDSIGCKLLQALGSPKLTETKCGLTPTYTSPPSLLPEAVRVWLDVRS